MVELAKVRDELKTRLVRNILGRVSFRRWFLGILTYIALMSIVAVNLMPGRVDLKAGEVAKRDIEAPRTIVNKPRTETLQKEARRKALKEASEDEENYEINQTESIDVEETIGRIFIMIRSRQDSIRQSYGLPGTPAAESGIRASAPALMSEIRKQEGVELLNKTIVTALSANASALQTMESDVLELVGEFMRTSRISEKNIEQVRDNAVRKIDDMNLAEPVVSAVKDLSISLIRPNLVLNFERVKRIEEESVRSIDPVMILKGQTIVRRGEVATPEQEALLGDLGLQKRRGNYMGLLGIGTLVLGLLALGIVYIRLFNPMVLVREEFLTLLSVLLVITAFIAKAVTSLTYGGIGYVIPVSFAAMLVTILMDARLAVLFNVMAALLVGVVTDFDLRFTIVALIGGMVGVFSLAQVHQRSDLTRAGLMVGSANFFTVASLGFIGGDFPLVTLAASGLGALNGVVSSILTIGSLPFIETFLGIASSIKLIELSNPTQPLLKRLLVEAPGTYHHSIIVGNLAEAAAEAIGADYVLARVGAHYHDIGKLKRPYFFVENQFSKENPHDNISPSLSTVIITSHVKDGVELAEEHKMPKSVIDFIRQHHGTSLVSFFYHKALESGANEGISDEQFRYSGPKPQTKETAIVMVADSVEAAVKSMTDPTPQKIEALVKKIIKDKVNDGQLDECDLTLKALDQIGEVFMTVLSGIFHSRIEYPDVSDGSGSKGNGR